MVLIILKKAGKELNSILYLKSISLILVICIPLFSPSRLLPHSPSSLFFQTTTIKDLHNCQLKDSLTPQLTNSPPRFLAISLTPYRTLKNYKATQLPTQKLINSIHAASLVFKVFKKGRKEISNLKMNSKKSATIRLICVLSFSSTLLLLTTRLQNYQLKNS